METKKFKVYHTRNWALNSKLHFDTEGYEPIRDNYQLVAEVHCLDVEQAYYFTNHIDKAWYEHLNVNCLVESRSTSVGDLIEDEDGKLLMCATCGWEKVEWSKDKPFKVLKDEYGEFLVPV